MASNNDESISTGLTFGGPGTAEVVAIGNFHKSLPHNRYGEVDPAAYATFKEVALTGGDYETVPRGFEGVVIPPEAGFVPGLDVTKIQSDHLNDPQAARSWDDLTGGANHYSMPQAPQVRSKSTAAEMAELQWMAVLRDVPFADFPTDSRVGHAVTDVGKQFGFAAAATEPGGLRLGLDLPRTVDGDLDIRRQTLFRCGLVGEDQGPIVSQFLLHDIAYGAQFIEQKVRPYAKDRDFLTEHDTWLRAQNAARDEWGHGYLMDNDFVADPTLEEMSGGHPVAPRRISTMRDLARFVNKDALHQAYFNAALLCLSWGIPFDSGNPYGSYHRQAPFGTFGGPDILTRVSEVASRALEVVWRQKWQVHRRLRPEAYGGLMQMQGIGFPENGGTTKRLYGLPQMAFDSDVAKMLKTTGLHGHKNYYLPLAFTAGSPVHPSYGAGHATVAGACVTALKAWFAEKTPLKQWLADHPKHSPYSGRSAPEDPVALAEPDAAGVLMPYGKPDADGVTVEGELNKLACNIAMGRSMGGVHWRTDNTRSLRLGEQVAAELLRIESLDYAEKRWPDGAAPTWSFTSFNGDDVIVFDGRVVVNGDVVDPKAGPL